MSKTYAEIIAGQLQQAGWTWTCGQLADGAAAGDWFAAACRDDDHRYVVLAPTLMTAFVELQRVVGARGDSAGE